MEKAKQKRSTYRSLTSKLISITEVVFSNGNTSVEELDELYEELVLRQFYVNQLYFEIQKEMNDVGETGNDITKYNRYTSKTVGCKYKVKKVLEKLITLLITTILSSNAAASKEICRRMVDLPYAKLPLLTIKKVSGDTLIFKDFGINAKQQVITILIFLM